MKNATCSSGLMGSLRNSKRSQYPPGGAIEGGPYAFYVEDLVVGPGEREELRALADAQMLVDREDESIRMFALTPRRSSLYLLLVAAKALAVVGK
ncbi:hypothetical protein ACRJ4W_02790 [Streptomyces sp. GLT-R25]